MSKLIRPEPFYGKDYESGREWLQRFYTFCIAGGWDPGCIRPGTSVDDQFRAGMMSLMHGAAAVWLDSLPAEARASFRNLRRAF